MGESKPKMLYKTANKSTSFIIESDLSKTMERDDGKDVEMNKIIYVMVQRDESNKAVKTLRYWQDVYKTRGMMKLMFGGNKVMLKFVKGKDADGNEVEKPMKKHYEFKKTQNKHRIFSVEPVRGKDNKGNTVTKMRFRIEEQNPSNKEDRQFLYFDIEVDDALFMSEWVYDNIGWHYQSEYNKEVAKS